MTDDRNPAEIEFDALVLERMNEYDFTAHRFIAEASPDGLGKGTGRWRVFHECPDRHLQYDPKDRSLSTFNCTGCGQTFSFTAGSS